MTNEDTTLSGTNLLLGLGFVGLLIGIAQTLALKEPPSWRVGIGRALMTTGVALAGGSLLAMLPAASPIAVIGVGAGLASLGTTVIERLIAKYIGAKAPE